MLANGKAKSFQFLSLPAEIRMLIYKLLLYGDNKEISINPGLNTYYRLDYDNPTPRTMASVRKIVAGIPSDLITSGEVEDLLGSKRLKFNKVIPFSKVEHVDSLQPINIPFGAKLDTGVYIGPVHTFGFKCLRPNVYQPGTFFNGNILRVCKTVLAETRSILYCENTLVFHNHSESYGMLRYLNGWPLSQLRRIRLETLDADDFLGSTLWNTLMHRCSDLREITLCALNTSPARWWVLIDTILRCAAIIADREEGTNKLQLRVLLNTFCCSGGCFGLSPLHARPSEDYETSLKICRKVVITVMGEMSLCNLDYIEAYKRNDWCFERVSPVPKTENHLHSWVELRWVKYQHG